MIVEGPNGCCPAPHRDFLRFLVGELGTPKLAQIFAYDKWLYPYRMQLHTVCSASDLDQRCLKTRMYFPTKYLRLYPKIIPKPHFGGPFNAKPIIHRALRKSHVNGAMKLKLYTYIGIGKYLGECVKIFPLGTSGGSAGPLNANLGPPYYLRNYWS